MIGLALAYTLELCAFLKHMTRMSLELEKSFAAVERVQEYTTDVPHEVTTGAEAPEGVWPRAGKIVMHNLQLRYRPELPLVLKGVSCTIEPTSKVGIVGRT